MIIYTDNDDSGEMLGNNSMQEFNKDGAFKGKTGEKNFLLVLMTHVPFSPSAILSTSFVFLTSSMRWLSNFYF